jgi:hypothetical protein
VDPDDYSTFCEVVGNHFDVSLSRAGRDCVARMKEGEQDRYVIAALPFANANKPSRRRGGPYRIWSTDFALLEEQLTNSEITQWLKHNGIRSDSNDHGTLNLPPNPVFWRP